MPVLISLEDKNAYVPLADVINTLIDRVKKNSIKEIKIENEPIIPNNLLEALKVNKSVKRLKFINCNLNKSAKVIAEVIETNKSIKVLTLTKCNLNISDKSLNLILEALKHNQFIKSLNLSKNFIGNASVKDFIEVITETFKFNTDILFVNLTGYLTNEVYGSDVVNSIVKVNRTLVRYFDTTTETSGTISSIDRLNGNYLLHNMCYNDSTPSGRTGRTLNTKNFTLIEKIVDVLINNFVDDKFKANSIFNKISFWNDFFKYKTYVKFTLIDKITSSTVIKYSFVKIYDAAKKYYYNNFGEIFPATSKGISLPLLPKDISNSITSQISRETVFTSIINSKNLSDQLVRAVQNNDLELVRSSLTRITKLQPNDIIKVKRELKNYLKSEEFDSNIREEIMDILNNFDKSFDKSR